MRSPRMTIRRWMIAVAILAVLMGGAVWYERYRLDAPGLPIVYDPLWRNTVPPSTYRIR
jgi:hypothetical protein